MTEKPQSELTPDEAAVLAAYHAGDVPAYLKVIIEKHKQAAEPPAAEPPTQEKPFTDDELKFVQSLRDGNLPHAMHIFKKRSAIWEPDEAKRAEPIHRSPNGTLYGYGWEVFPELTIRTTNKDDLHNVPEEIAELGDGFVYKMEHFRLAFAIVGNLIENGAIDLNFSNTDWHGSFEIYVNGVTEILNRH